MISRKPIIILDACSIINLIWAEIEFGSDVITHRLKKDTFQFQLCEKVVEEALDNAKVQLDKLKKLSTVNKQEFSDKENEIEQKIASFRDFITYDADILNNVGADFFRLVKRLSRYAKNNGEFYSAALSLFLSRMETSQLTFYTDDIPAQAHFSPFFQEQQIGKIEDTVDLLVFIYWADPEFNKEHLEFFLDELRSQYDTDTKLLLDLIKNYKGKHPPKHLKNIRKALKELESKLGSYDLTGISELRKQILQHEKQHKSLCNNLKIYDNIFRAEGNSGNNMLDKIRNTLRNLKDNRIYKIW